MSANFEVRKAQPDEADAVGDVVCKAYEGYVSELGGEPAPMKQNYVELIMQGKVMVARRNDCITGVLVAYERRGGLHVENVAVDPQCQGSGLGQRLMREAEHIAQRLGRKRIDLYTNAIMRGNIPFYEKLGYTQLGRAIEDGYDRIFFSKALG